MLLYKNSNDIARVNFFIQYFAFSEANADLDT